MARQKAYRNQPEIKARKKAYYAKPEIKARNKARQKAYYAKPERKARVYERENGLPEGSALPSFLMPLSERYCFFCGEPPQGQMELDHDHGTKEIRGWSHEPCNQIEGRVGASPNPGALARSLAAVHSTPNPLTGLFSGADRPHIVCAD